MRSALVIGVVLVAALVAGCESGTTSTGSSQSSQVNARIARAYEREPGFTTWCREADQAGRVDPQAAVTTLTRILGSQIRKLGGDPSAVLLLMLKHCS